MRKITQVPLETLWDEGGDFGQRLQRLTSVQIQNLLREGPCRFVEVDVGKPLHWISINECFNFWKRSRQSIADDNRIFIDDFPEGYAYFASEWTGRNNERLIVLEKSH